uniref:Protein kinase domain-containing protein n=1 Tax=Davidia involucrata TaxID=16924 RepID=A0A5B7AKC6_DAVIN
MHCWELVFDGSIGSAFPLHSFSWRLQMKGPFCLFALLLLAPICAISLKPSLNDDVLGLIVFKADVKDPNGKLVSWNEEDDSPCNWVGVKCNPRSNRVSELVLDGFALSGRIGRGLLQLQSIRKLSLAKNNLTGNISLSLAQLENLGVIDLSENSLSGPIPGDFFQQCGSLRSISLANNNFSGQIPGSLSSCSTLAAINFSSNQFLGSLPPGIWSLHALRSLDLSNNLLDGEIPKGIEGLNNLRAINLRKNQFLGQIPDGIGGCLLLRSIDFSENSLSGDLPNTMQKLALCTDLNLQKNSFVGEVPEWIGELRSLETLDLSENKFSGQVTTSIGLLQSLKVLNISMNAFTGSLPESLINCKNLLALDSSWNLLTGSLPSWIFKLGLQKVLLSGNRLSGSVDSLFSSSMENLNQKLQVLDLSQNALSGEIPSAVGNFSGLLFLNLSRNSLIGGIPASICESKALDILDLSENQLNGSIPLEIGGAVSLKELRLEKNSLAGKIPLSIENCSSLTSLILSHNNLIGQIPPAIAKLTYLQNVDLSFNKLTGTLPKQLANLPGLISFNISHNQLEGELPAGGFFNTISPSSVSGNPSLCGAVVNKTCHTVLPKPIVLNPNSSDSTPGTIPQNLGHKKIILSISALIAIGAAAVIVIGVIAITVLNLRIRSSTSHSAAALTFSGGDDFSHSPTTDANSGKLVMFSGDLDFSTGAHALLNKDCELGRGGFGAVYRTVLGDGRPVAIKKLTVSSLVKSQEDFEREVKKLGKIRHQNLVALEGYYWTSSLQLLIHEFVSGGSLYKHLHEGSGGNFLSWNERFNIILGTAKSLAYLHQMNIIHYNLKSSNILIDDSGEPKVADFGLARLLPMLDRYVLSSKIQSALGYMAPEFACRTVKITEKCDVYGFGVLVLEVVTGKRPVEYMEDDVVVLCDMVRGALEEGRVEECIDGRLHGNFPAEEAIPVMKLGLICTSQVPSNRPDMGEVVNILELIRCPSEGQEELV